MNKLLSAGFARMFKFRMFWIITVLSAALTALMRLFMYFQSQKVDASIPLDSGFFFAVAFSGIAMAVFCSFFVGTEYNDGTMRNKLAVGHSRLAVYFSNLVVCAVAGVIFLASSCLASLLIGIPLFGFFTGSAASFLFLLALSLAVIIAYTAIFVLIAMTNQSKAASAVIALLLAFTLFFAATYIYSSLNEPEFYDAYEYTENGVTVSESSEPNPNYLTGAKRQVYEILFDCLPGCQASRVAQMYDPEPEAVFALYSCLIVLLTTAGGAAAFKRKNIK